jgi:hypothetical protein
MGVAMQANVIEATFQQLCEAAARSYAESPTDALYQEPHYLAVLRFVLDHPKEKDIFLRAYVSMMDNPKKELIPLIQFCMHQLQWDEVAVAAQRIAEQSNDSLIVRWMELIRRSFTKEWPGLGYYDYYLGR